MKWIKYAELCRVMIAPLIMLSVPNSLEPDTSVFLVKQDVEFPLGIFMFHEALTASSSQKRQLSIRFIHTTRKVNNSSVVYHCQARDVSTDTILMESVHVLVQVSTKTRRATSFSQQFRQFIEECSQDNNLPLQNVKPENLASFVPKNHQVFLTTVQVSVTYIDHNGHTNNTSYMKFAYQCLDRALSQNFPLKLSKSLSESRIRKSSIRFLNESNVGDCIKIFMWQTEDDHLHFICRRKESDLAYLTLVYY